MGVRVINRISKKSYCNLNSYDLCNAKDNSIKGIINDSICNKSIEQISSSSCTGREIICMSIPCPISIVLLGTSLQLEFPLFKLTSDQGLTAEQISALIKPLIQELNNLKK